MNKRDKNNSLIQGFDWPTLYLYFLLVAVGLLAIFAVEHREGDNIMQTIVHFNRNYSRQLLWWMVSLAIGVVILLMDSKFFTATANIFYAFGILLLLLVLVMGRNVNGSHSWLVIGGFQFQPAEFTKLCTTLALAKYMSSLETDFTQFRSRLIATAIVLLPAAIILMQDETGLALVYFSFFLVMYREGLPGIILIVGFSMIALVLSALLIEKNLLFGIFTGIALIVIYFNRRAIRKNRLRLGLIAGIWVFCGIFVMFVVPYVFQHVLRPYQVTRIYDMLGKQVSAKSSYNVLQSKIAIGSGGLVGKGYLKGTQTRFDFVPEQSTDFIFCTIGEEFGFTGSLVLILLYLVMLFRIVTIAERQRSSFSRIYAYSLACIMFFHFAINISMTIGLAPVIGIPLPLISYGGSSLLTFTLMIFILIRLDADRQMVLR